MVAPLGYAIACTPSAALVCDYKNHPCAARGSATARSSTRLWGRTLPATSAASAAPRDLPVSCRLVIPSPNSRPGRRPFAELATTMTAVGDAVALIPAPQATCDRAVNDKLVLAPAARLDGQHVLILDDVWTTGSNAQSGALAVRRAGAAAVSVMVVGRWLNHDRRVTANFIKTRLHREYNPDICPVIGAECP